MTMKKISPMKLSRNVTTCRSSQRPISIMKSSPVTFLCAITGLMTALCSVRHNNQSGRGVKALPVKNNQAMKRKSIYKILWRVLLFCLAWRFTSVAGAGTAITAYIVFRADCFLLRVCFSVLYALGVALLFLLFSC